MERSMDDRPRSTGRSLRRDAGSIARRLAPLFGVALAVVAVDQTAKVLVRATLERGEHWPEGVSFLRISHVENTGAAFGIFEGGGPFLVASSLIGIVAVLAYIVMGRDNDWRIAGALALILGGAVGNLIDRLGRGSVTDFIDPMYYPSFNTADSAIVVGVSVIVLLTLFGGGEQRPAPDTEPPGPVPNDTVPGDTLTSDPIPGDTVLGDGDR